MKHFFVGLGLIFITLKLTGYIAWSWWWVTAPLWGGPIIMFITTFLSIYYIARWGTPLEKIQLKMKGF